jgi:hypothetical protein
MRRGKGKEPRGGKESEKRRKYREETKMRKANRGRRTDERSEDEGATPSPNAGCEDFLG